MAALALAGAVMAPGQPVEVCSLADERLAEVSGAVSDGERWFVVNDGGRRSTVYVLNRECDVEDVITGPTDPYDVEDLARAEDGTLWLADIGDNAKDRETVALISLTPDGRSAVHRLTYPDGAKDAEALLLSRDGVPHLVTKNPFGTADIYRPAGRLRSPGPTPLERVGSLTLRPTDTQGGPVPSAVGSVLVTGGAVSPDGTVVVLRTYTDAYVYPAPDGDVVAALGNEPLRVPLPNEAQGEAIAIEPDGTLVSLSEGVGSPVRTVAGATPPDATPAEATEEPATEPAPAPESGGEEPTAAPPAEDNGLATIPAIGVTAVVVGALLLFMHRRSAKRS